MLAHQGPHGTVLNRHRWGLWPWSLEYPLVLSLTFQSTVTPPSSSCPAWPQINQLSILFQPKASMNQLGNKSPNLMSGTCHSTSTVHLYNVLVFLAPTRYRVAKITCSSSKVVLRTIKHTLIYPGSVPSSEVIALHQVVWYWRWIGVTKGWIESLRSFHGEGGNGSRTPCLKSRGSFIDRVEVW
jgi:hypothetical protein